MDTYAFDDSKHVCDHDEKPLESDRVRDGVASSREINAVAQLENLTLTRSDFLSFPDFASTPGRNGTLREALLDSRSTKPQRIATRARTICGSKSTRPSSYLSTSDADYSGSVGEQGGALEGCAARIQIVARRET